MTMDNRQQRGVDHVDPRDVNNRDGEAQAAIEVTIVEGHRVASGLAGDQRFPHGTLALQAPFFAQHGLDLTPFYRGTLNVSIAPYRYIIHQPKQTLRNIQWSSVSPPEDFSFFDCELRVNAHAAETFHGLVYYPHPETKPEHFQAPDILEILAPHIPDLNYGDQLTLRVPPTQMQFLHT